MKVARIQSSLRDLHKDIGNCERQLSRVLSVKDGQAEPVRSRSRSGARNQSSKTGNRPPTVSHLSRTVTKQTSVNQKARGSRSPTKAPNDEDRNVVYKEVNGSRHSPARVELVIRTKPYKRRSRSAQGDRGVEIPSRDNVGDSRKVNANQSTQRKNASWGHIFQQQSGSSSNIKRDEQARGKACTVLNYSSSDDRSSVELERWVQSIPCGKERTSYTSSLQANSGNVRTSDVKDDPFNPLRTLNFLVKELRGKVHKDYDENMQRIIDDMEKVLCSIPANTNQWSPPTKLVSSHHRAPSRTRTSLPFAGDNDHIHSKEKVSPKSQEPKETHSASSPDLVNRLLSTVSRITKITGLPEQREETYSHIKKDKLSGSRCHPETSLQGAEAQLESGCKQLEEICLQMRESYEQLKHQNSQLLSDLKQKNQQLQTVVGKNQQLTLYAADIRQEMLRQQQAFEMNQQENEKAKQKTLSQQRELQDSNCHLNKRLEEALQENERLVTELQLCRLEKDKMSILMSNKDLEVAKLRNEIININALVAEQLTNIRSLSGKQYSPNELGQMMQAVSRLHETVDSINVPFEKDEPKNHIGDGEGSRSRPVCSSPTSSVNSSLYSSWQLMSDITATDINEGEASEKIYKQLKYNVSKKDKDSGINSATPIDAPNRESTSRTDDDITRKREQSASELKAGLHDMFQLLKKQTSDAVNIVLPSPPIAFDKLQETLGMSQWTELSASESTVVFHSSDESDSDGVA